MKMRVGVHMLKTDNMNTFLALKEAYPKLE